MCGRGTAEHSLQTTSVVPQRCPWCPGSPQCVVSSTCGTWPRTAKNCGNRTPRTPLASGSLTSLSASTFECSMGNDFPQELQPLQPSLFCFTGSSARSACYGEDPGTLFKCSVYSASSSSSVQSVRPLGDGLVRRLNSMSSRSKKPASGMSTFDIVSWCEMWHVANRTARQGRPQGLVVEAKRTTTRAASASETWNARIVNEDMGRRWADSSRSWMAFLSRSCASHERQAMERPMLAHFRAGQGWAELGDVGQVACDGQGIGGYQSKPSSILCLSNVSVFTPLVELSTPSAT